MQPNGPVSPITASRHDRPTDYIKDGRLVEVPSPRTSRWPILQLCIACLLVAKLPIRGRLFIDFHGRETDPGSDL